MRDDAITDATTGAAASWRTSYGFELIAITGQILYKIEEEAIKSGFTHVLEKPVAFKDLLQTIKQFLDLNDP